MNVGSLWVWQRWIVYLRWKLIKTTRTVTFWKNQLVGSDVNLQFTNWTYCIVGCGSSVEKTFNAGDRSTFLSVNSGLDRFVHCAIVILVQLYQRFYHRLRFLLSIRLVSVYPRLFFFSDHLLQLLRLLLVRIGMRTLWLSHGIFGSSVAEGFPCTYVECVCWNEILL